MAWNTCHFAERTHRSGLLALYHMGSPDNASSTPSSAPPASGPKTGWSIGVSGTGSLTSWIDAIDRGFDAQAVRRLQDRMALPVETVAAWLGTSPRTLKRRETKGRLTAEESDRLFRLARLFERTVDVLGSVDTARAWLKQEQHALGGRVPLEIARYEPGAREVERLLGRVEHGIPV